MNISKFKAVYLFFVLAIVGVIGMTLLQQFISGSSENVPAASEVNSNIVENNAGEVTIVEVQENLFQETKGIIAEEKDSDVSAPAKTTTTASAKTTTKPKTVTKPAPKPSPSPAPTPSTCPQITMNCVPCKAGEAYCRYEPGKTTGYKGWSCQNNNPSNIRYSTSRINLIKGQGGPAPCGERVDSRGGTYMIFKTYADGRNGLKAYLKAINAGQHSSYKDVSKGIYCGNCSLKFFFSKYAPAGDQNDPNSYSNKVAARLGVSAETTTLSWIVANKLEQFMDAIQIQEGWFTR